jgi:hypothetical protein
MILMSQTAVSNYKIVNNSAETFPGLQNRALPEVGTK